MTPIVKYKKETYSPHDLAFNKLYLANLLSKGTAHAYFVDVKRNDPAVWALVDTMTYAETKLLIERIENKL